jgi:hypothetical protein
VKRRTGALWIIAVGVVASCAHANIGDSSSAGGGGSDSGGAGGTMSSNITATTGPTGTGGTGVTTGPGGTGGTGVTTGPTGTGGTSVSSATGPSGTGGAGGLDLDAGPDADDGGSPSGFGPCVTQQDIASQSSQPFEVGFCFNPFACFACSNDAVNPGDIVCSPKCLCVPLPPLCMSDAGPDAPDDGGPPPIDGGPGDAGPMDAGPPPSDGGPQPMDAAVIDSGP